MAFVRSEGLDIYWRERGDGEPLLLIMGLGYSADMWQHVEGMLAERFRVISFDNRGIGRSGASDGVQTIPVMTTDAVAVLDAAGVGNAHVFGMSMGGYIAQELALSHPDRVRTLVLGCTACCGPHVVQARPEVLEVLLARAEMVPEQGVRAMVPYIYDATTPRARIEADIAVRLTHYPDPDTYLGQIEGVRQWQSCDRLDRLDLPVLILHGENDQLIPIDNGCLLETHIRGAQMVTIPNASHIFITDQPEYTVQRVSTFLDQLATS